MKVSTEVPVTTRHRHDMTEKLLKATLSPNKQQQLKEPHHEKTCLCLTRTTKAQISLHIHAV